jgi:hypothetical protein
VLTFRVQEDKSLMQIRVTPYGWFKTGVDTPDGLIELTMPDVTDAAGVIETLRETSPLLDPRACLAMVDDAKAVWTES